MNEQKIAFISLFAAIGAVGYVTFHGHRRGQDCWLCSYRGITFATGCLAFGAFAAWDKE